MQMGIQEALTGVFTDDPLNWVKWAVVFAVLILGYVIAVPAYKKITYRFSWERKRDIARSRNHIIEVALLRKHRSGEVSHYDWHAVYRYTVGGEEKEYRAFFKHPGTPPFKLYLYYLEDPKRVFSYDEYHYENHKGCLYAVISFLPWILAVLFLFILQVKLPFFRLCGMQRAPAPDRIQIP